MSADLQAALETVREALSWIKGHHDGVPDAVAAVALIEQRLGELESDYKVMSDAGNAVCDKLEAAEVRIAELEQELATRKEKAKNLALTHGDLAKAEWRARNDGERIAELERERDEWERRCKLEYQVRVETRDELEALERALREIAGNELADAYSTPGEMVLRHIARLALDGKEEGIPWGPDHPSYDEMGQ